MLVRLDRAAAAQKKSRNRLVVEAIERLLAEDNDRWPDDFFDDARLSPADRRALRQGANELRGVVAASRKNRRAPPF